LRHPLEIVKKLPAGMEGELFPWDRGHGTIWEVDITVKHTFKRILIVVLICMGVLVLATMLIPRDSLPYGPTQMRRIQAVKMGGLIREWVKAGKPASFGNTNKMGKIYLKEVKLKLGTNVVDGVMIMESPYIGVNQRLIGAITADIYLESGDGSVEKIL
jgi:hypothetical protein